jgi:hypothetical protein
MIPSARRLLRVSRFTHRWLGLVGLLYFFGMAVSGVLLNHPELIAGADLPRTWIPGDYNYRDWNRNSLRGIVIGPAGEQYIYGEAGVWRLDPGSRAPEVASAGLDPSVYYRDTRSLVLVEAPKPFLLAGTRGGLFSRILGGNDSWQRVGLGRGEVREAVVDLLRVEDRLFALTRSHLYAAPLDLPLEFVDATPARESKPDRGIPLFRLVFHLHSGEVWGLPGRLAVDLVGLTLGFLTVTGGYFWWRKRRRTLARGAGGRLARTGLSWHARLGIWLSPVVLFVAVTGLFQRPPFLIAIVNAAYPPRYHPAAAETNPWHDLLRKVAYDPGRRGLVLSTADGFYEGPADLSRPFRRVVGGPPVSVMGATVFRQGLSGRYWVGSMSGLYVWDRRRGWVIDAFTGQPPFFAARGPVGDHKVVGFAAGDRIAIADYDRGLTGLDGRPVDFPMPEIIDRGGRISLWHALFEFHNGRLFGFLLGWWVWLVVPLGGFGLLAEVMTGVFDRWLPKFAKRRPRSARADGKGVS